MRFTACRCVWSRNGAGMIVFTLQAPRVHQKLLYQVGQLQQIVVAKQTPSCGQDHEWICRQHSRPARWNRAQEAAAVVKVNSVLTPVVAVSDQLEPLASQWMIWMDNLESSVRTVAMRCS